MPRLSPEDRERWRRNRDRADRMRGEEVSLPLLRLVEARSDGVSILDEIVAVIPATLGWFAAEPWPGPAEDFFLDPVIAWAVGRHRTLPITPVYDAEHWAKRPHMAVVCPSGEVFEWGGDDGVYSNIEEWHASLTSSATP